MNRVTRRQFLSASVLAGMYGLSPWSKATGSGSLPWRNWSGGQVAHPAGRLQPSSVDQLVSMLKSTKGQLRPVGSGHSFTALVPTDGYLVVIDQLSGLLARNDEMQQATFGAGSRLGDMGPLLTAIDQAMFILPDIDRQTLAGATATATHGTGLSVTNLSGYIEALQLATPAGEILDLDANHEPDIFTAARVSLGALGIVTQITLQNRKPYRLKARSWAQKTEEILEGFEESAAAHRHFEMFPLTHSDYALGLAIDETSEDINNLPPSPEEAASFGEAMISWTQVSPGERKPLINGLAEQIEASEVVDLSYKILSNIRNDRFNEMEYSVPREVGAACLREILQTIEKKEIDVVFPLEYRYVKGDDLWLSMSTGEEDHAAISVHRTASEDYWPYFNEIEPIFWKYGGRPHWGKIHSLSHKELTRLYPHYEDFLKVRQELDPNGRMLNDHLRRLFDIS